MAAAALARHVGQNHPVTPASRPDGERPEDSPAEATRPPAPPFVVTVLYFHGTRAQLGAGDLIEPGYRSNFGAGRRAKHVYLTATLDAAVWGAELAAGEGTARIYLVEPTGQIEDDPNLTDKKFPGNPTKSYRSKEPLRVIGELWEWQGHAPDVLQAMKDNVARLAELGVEADDD